MGSAHLVHGVDQDLGSVGEVLHRVHPHAATLRTQTQDQTPAPPAGQNRFGSGSDLGQNPQDEPGVGHHLPDQQRVTGDHRQDVWDEVSHSAGETKRRNKP